MTQIHSKEPKGFCNGCVFLRPQEEDQTDKKEDHACIIFRIILKHGRHHPKIPMPWDILCAYYDDGEG